MGVVKNLMVRAGADFSAITKQSQKASKSMQSMSASISKATSRINNALSAVGIGLSVAAIVAAGKDAVQAYKEQGEAEAKLAQVMKTTTGAAAGEIRAIKQLTDAQQELGIVGGDVQMAGAQELATYLTQTKSLEKLIPVMNDMVAQQYGYGASAEQAANIATMLGKVIEGQTGGLSRYGYYFDEAQKKVLKYGTEEERVATLADIVEGSVGGMNYALAATPIGRMQQLSNTLGDIKARFGEAIVTVGTVFLPLLNKVANMLAGIASLAMRVAQAIANVFGKKIGASAAAVAGGAGGAADSFDDMADAAGGAGKAAKEAAKSVMGFDELNKLTDNSSASGGGGGAAFGAGGIGDIGGIAAAEEEAAESSTWLERALQRVKDLVESLDFEPLKASWDALRQSAEHLGSVILGYLGDAWDAVLVPLAHWTIEEFVPALVSALAQALEFLATVLERIKPVLQWLWDNILEPLRQFTWDLIIDSLEYIRQKLSDLTDLISGKTTFKEFLDTLSPAEKILMSIATAILAVSVAMAVVKSVTEGVSAAVGIAKGAFELITSPIGLVVLAIAALIFIGIELYQHWDDIKAKAEELKEKLAETWTNIKDTVNEKIQNIKDKFAELKTDIQTKVAEIKAFFDALGEKWQTVKDNISGKIDELRDGFDTCMGKVSEFTSNVAAFFEDLWSKISGPIQSVVDGISGIFGWARDAVTQLNELFKFDGFSLSGTWGNIKSGVSNAASWVGNTAGKIFGHASGGFPDAGQLFIARESGPELVGSFGGSANAVANNDQIIAGIRQGVYEAVSSAMSNANFSAKVYLDSREIKNGQVRLNRAMGA